MNKDKFNFYKSDSENHKYLYGIMVVLALGSLVLSQLVLPTNAESFSFYDSYYQSTHDYGYNSYNSNSYYPSSYSDYSYSPYGYYDYSYGNSNYSQSNYSYDYAYDYYQPQSYNSYGSNYNSYYPYDYSYNYTSPVTIDYGNYNYDYPYSYNYQTTNYQTTDYQPTTYQQTDNFQQTNSYQQNSLNPRFNIFTPYVHTQTPGQDYYLLDGKNDTKNTGWNFPISADPGDTLTFSVYYHNGVINTTARNTTLKVNLPANESYYHNLSASLWADNAENATPSSPMTQNLSVNLSSSAKLELVQGSVKWYPNQKDWRYDQPTTLPFGQTGTELFASGLRIGDVTGCWEFSGYVIFKVKISQIIPADLQITKQVKNISENQTVWQKSVYAAPEDRVAFLINVRNNNAGSIAKNVTLTDILPNKLNFISGSLRINGQPSSSNISLGVPLGDIQSGQGKEVYFEAKVEQSWAFQRGVETPLVNEAVVSALNIPQKRDSATVIVKYTCDPGVIIPGGR